MSRWIGGTLKTKLKVVNDLGYRIGHPPAATSVKTLCWVNRKEVFLLVDQEKS